MTASYKGDTRDFEWAFGLNRLCLRLMGVWPDDEDIEERSFSVQARVPLMILTIFVGLLLPQLYALALVIGNLPLVIDNLMTSCAQYTCCTKLFFIWRSKRVFRPVIRSVTKDWHRLKSDRELEAMAREAGRARLFTISGYVIMIGCYSGFALSPLLGFNIRMITNITDYGGRYMLVQSYYPYDYSRSPIFELTYGLQMIAGVFIGMSVSIPDNYFGALVFHACAQFEILGINIENFIREDDKTLMTDFEDGSFKKRLKIFIDRHVHLMANITAMEQSFRFINMAQIMCMCIMVVCLGFQILGMFDNTDNGTSVVQVLTLFFTILNMMIHALVDCFASETLALRSTEIFYHIYNSRWYMVSQKNARDLIPMMIMSKTPQRLSVGKMFYLSLSSYGSILKSSAGYISMLIAVSGR